ncbi:unnamed protein product [Pleuronectes platessa]|uniref:Uncharacterized protein n=1 Tax=Pleuronectes platessa TaxID=8262 RepID=A0A9N7W4I0_PLEPL|nr:unnamed protein product [Pleuronectes platessa]
MRSTGPDKVGVYAGRGPEEFVVSDMKPGCCRAVDRWPSPGPVPACCQPIREPSQIHYENRRAWVPAWESLPSAQS